MNSEEQEECNSMETKTFKFMGGKYYFEICECISGWECHLWESEGNRIACVSKKSKKSAKKYAEKFISTIKQYGL